MTGGWLDAGTVPVLAAVLMRGLRIDKNYLPFMSGINSALIRGWLPMWTHGRGVDIGQRFFGGEKSGPAPLSGTASANVSGAPTEPKPAPEPIPGEETVA
jgi:hypothetical protein